MKSQFADRLPAIILGSAIVYYCISVLIHTHTIGDDLGVYLSGAKSILTGQRIYNPDDYMPFTSPPMSVWLFIPFIRLQSETAARIWMTLSFLGYFGSIAISRKILFPELSFRRSILVAFAFLMIFPTQYTLILGQMNLLVLFLTILAFYVVSLPGSRIFRRQVACGVLLGIGTGMKIIPVILILFLVMKRYWTALVSFLLFMAISAVITVSAFHIPFSELSAYGNRIMLSFISPGTDFLSVTGAQYNQSVTSFVSTFIPDNQLRTATVILGVLIFLTVSAAIWLKIRPAGHADRTVHDWYLFSLLIATEVLWINGTAWEHHLVYLYPLLLLYVRYLFRETRWHQILIAGVIFVSFLIDPLYPAPAERGFLFRYHGLISFFYVFIYLNVKLSGNRIQRQPDR